jgi:hypothetical protein
MLNRFLGWSDGGRTPREPGIVLPELRPALAEYLRDTGNYPGAETWLLTSRLYLQSTTVEPDGFGDDPDAPQRPIFAYGPVKPARAEAWLDSLAPLTFIDIGTCDPRYPDYYPYLLLYDAYDQGLITSLEELERNFILLQAMQENRSLLYPGQYGILEPNYYYVYYARQLGGCPGFGSPRGDPAGLAYGFQQETFAELACLYANNALPPDPDARFDDVLAHQMNLLYGRGPSTQEISIFNAGIAGCEGEEECTATGYASSVCTALAGSSEMLFY